MNENANNNAEWTLSNILAIAGFAVLVVLLAWLAIQVVRLLPSAFNSLATIWEDNQQALEENADEGESENPIVVVEEDKDEEPVKPTPEEEKPVATSTPSKPTTPKPTTPNKPTTPQYHTVTTYVVPVSDPNGRTDLEVAFVGIGRVNSDGKFVADNSFRENEIAAMQFRVKNIGTKTSSDWRFEADLPNGDTMKSLVQRPLKPGEMSTLTIEFLTDDRNGNRHIGVSVTGGNDVNPNNNTFRTTLNVR